MGGSRCWGVLVGVFLQVACAVVGRVLYRTGVQFPHKLLIFKNEIEVYDYQV